MTRTPRLKTTLSAAACLLALGSLAACGDDADPTTDATPTPTPSVSPSSTAGPTPTPTATPEGTTINATIRGDDIEPNGERVKVKRGETITIVVDSNRAGELHVHSTPEQQLEYSTGTTTLTLTLDKPGIVDVEDHVADKLLVSLQVS